MASRRLPFDPEDKRVKMFSGTAYAAIMTSSISQKEHHYER